MLSVICITRSKAYAVAFLRELNQRVGALQDAELVIGAHGSLSDAVARAIGAHDSTTTTVVQVEGEFMEQMVDPVFDATIGDYVLRLDDDERLTQVAWDWIAAGKYRERDNWHFGRGHLWPDVRHYIASSPFFPDFQTRLSTREKFKRPNYLHASSPYPGWATPDGVFIEHHAFLVKSYRERATLTERYARLHGQEVKLPVQVMPEDAAELRIRQWR